MFRFLQGLACGPVGASTGDEGAAAGGDEDGQGQVAETGGLHHGTGGHVQTPHSTTHHLQGVIRGQQ